MQYSEEHRALDLKFETVLGQQAFKDGAATALLPQPVKQQRRADAPAGDVHPSALRGLAKDRPATPAEKAAARRFANALAAKIGKRPNQSRRKGSGAPLAEPPAAKWRRRWIAQLEAAQDKIEVAWTWMHWVRTVGIIGFMLMAAFGGKAVPR